jgi:hypothetical protein
VPSIDTLWFDVALIATIFAFGGPLFGHFEAHKPRWKRALKVAAFLLVMPAISALAGREWMLGLLGALVVAVVVIHGWWLPKHGVNGWTAEPRERYYELLGIVVDPVTGRPTGARRRA